MNNYSLQKILGNNVVELTFVRRHVAPGWNDIRGLLGTTNYKLLNGIFGKAVLHFQPPKYGGWQAMGYNYKQKNLCVVWDFFRQEYRVFGAENVNVRQLFDLNDPEQEKLFYDWFYEFIINMTEQQKLDFMGYEGEAYAAIQQAKQNALKAKPVPAPTAPQQKPVVNNKPPITQRIANVYNNVKNYITQFFKNKS